MQLSLESRPRLFISWDNPKFSLSAKGCRLIPYKRNMSVIFETFLVSFVMPREDVTIGRVF